MEKSATLQTRVAKTLAGALVGAAVGYGVTTLAGFGGASLFALFGAIICAGIAFGVPGLKFDPSDELEDASRRSVDLYEEEDDDRTAGRGIYADDDH